MHIFKKGCKIKIIRGGYPNTGVVLEIYFTSGFAFATRYFGSSTPAESLPLPREILLVQTSEGKLHVPAEYCEPYGEYSTIYGIVSRIVTSSIYIVKTTDNNYYICIFCNNIKLEKNSNISLRGTLLGKKLTCCTLIKRTKNTSNRYSYTLIKKNSESAKCNALKDYSKINRNYMR